MGSKGNGRAVRSELGGTGRSSTVVVPGADAGLLPVTRRPGAIVWWALVREDGDEADPGPNECAFSRDSAVAEGDRDLSLSLIRTEC